MSQTDSTATAGDPLPASASLPSSRGGLSALSLAMLLAALGTSIANVALPTIADEFDASFGAVQWVVLAYLLAITTLIVSVGRLGDLTGRRRLLLAGIATFTAASVACGLAPTLPALTTARAVQGLGAAILMALALAFVAETVAKDRIAAAIGLLGTMSAIGTALGPSLGGFLIDGLGWRAIFLVNVPLGLAALALAHRHLPADRPAQGTARPRFDRLGTVLLAATLGAYTLAVTLGDGDLGALNLILLLAAAAAAAAFVAAERRSRSPLVRLSMLADPGLRGGLSTSALVSTVMMATLVVGPFYLSRSLGLEPAAVGLVMTVGPAVAAVTASPAGRIADRIGARRMVGLGLVAALAGSLGLATAPGSLGVSGYLGPMVVLTAGYAVFQTANNATVMAEVDAERRGLVSAMLNLSRNLGLITGASVMGAIFAFAAGAGAGDVSGPGSVAAGMRATYLVAAALLAVALLLSLSERRRESRLELDEQAAYPAGRAIRPRSALRTSPSWANWRTR